jgi:hypothetical protein
MKRLAVLLLLTGLASLSGLAQGVTGREANFFPIEELKPGMKATGYTVFVGSEPEPFELEILGVLNGFPNPGQSAVLSRLLGERMNHTGVFQGMSGSPVYIGNRLVGAVAFGYQFARDPIAGITPIRHMIELFEKHGSGTKRVSTGGTGGERPVNFAELAMNGDERALAALLPTPPPAVTGPGTGSLQPIATPLAVTGIAPEVLNRFAPFFSALGFNPVAGVAGAAPVSDLKKAGPATLKPGSTVVVPLIRGDYSVSAAGTVTWRDGDRIYAFGHPFLSLGLSDLPMHEGEVVTVLSSAASSFKLSYPTGMVGVVRGDRSTGIYGELGAAPRMIPVEINLHTSRGESRRYSFDVVADRFLTPVLLQMTLISTISSTERTIGDSTLLVNGTINLRQQVPIRTENRISVTLNAPIVAAIAATQPISTIIGSDFPDLAFEKITYDITSRDLRQTGQLDRLWLGRTEVRRGETIELHAVVRREGGREYVERFQLTVPADAPAGQLNLTIGDGAALQSSDPRTGFTPRSLAQLVRELNGIRRPGRLHARLSQAETGAVIRSEELPALPPSILATLGSDRTSGGYTLTAARIVFEQELPPTEFIITGQRSLKIKVVE